MFEFSFSPAPERQDQGRASPREAHAIAGAGFEVEEVGGATVAGFATLQTTLNGFGRKEFRCLDLRDSSPPQSSCPQTSPP